MGENVKQGPKQDSTIPAAGPEATPTTPRAAAGFLAGSERAFTRRDFLMNSSLAGMVITAGGIFFRPERASASFNPAGRTAVPGGGDSPTASPAEAPPPLPQGQPVTTRQSGRGPKGSYTVAQHCSHGSHGSHGSHAR